MEITRSTLKALASERRLDILKALVERRKMPAELSRELHLSGSTIVEHLSVLESAGLVKRIDTGHKWIYYDLTEKGVGLVKPKWPVQFMLILSLGLLLMIGGMFSISSTVYQPFYYTMTGSAPVEKIMEQQAGVATAATGAVSNITNNVTSNITENITGNVTNVMTYLPVQEINWFAVMVITVGTVLLALGIVSILRDRKWSRLK
jgi:DNA-binding transcriptional ArsR family regulator